MDRAPAFGAGRWGFNSLQARETPTKIFNMKKIILISILFLLPLTCFAKDEFVNSSWPLQLIIESDKKEYQLGDDIVLTCKIKNVSKAPVSFFKDTNPTHLNLTITSLYGNKCRIADSSQVMIGNNDPVTLYKDEEFEYSLQGKIMKGSRNIAQSKFKGGGYEEVQGLYIQFPTWSIFLDDGFTIYRISARYRDGSWVKTADPRFLVDNESATASKREISKELRGKWRGKLVSGPIMIEIIEND